MFPEREKTLYQFCRNPYNAWENWSRSRKWRINHNKISFMFPTYPSKMQNNFICMHVKSILLQHYNKTSYSETVHPAYLLVLSITYDVYHLPSLYLPVPTSHPSMYHSHDYILSFCHLYKYKYINRNVKWQYFLSYLYFKI